MAAWRDLANYDDLGAARYRHRKEKKRGDDQLNNRQTRMVRADQEHALFVAALLTAIGSALRGVGGRLATKGFRPLRSWTAGN